MPSRLGSWSSCWWCSRLCSPAWRAWTTLAALSAPCGAPSSVQLSAVQLVPSSPTAMPMQHNRIWRHKRDAGLRIFDVHSYSRTKLKIAGQKLGKLLEFGHNPRCPGKCFCPNGEPKISEDAKSDGDSYLIETPSGHLLENWYNFSPSLSKPTTFHVRVFSNSPAGITVTTATHTSHMTQ